MILERKNGILDKLLNNPNKCGRMGKIVRFSKIKEYIIEVLERRNKHVY